MDLFKRKNVNLATSLDFNAPRVVTIKNRKAVVKMLSKYSRRKLKDELRKEVE